MKLVWLRSTANANYIWFSPPTRWLQIDVKPLPGDRNISHNLSQHCWVQHACVWPLGCDLLQHVATCWVRFLAQIWKWSNFPCNICGCCMMLESFGQVRATMLRLGMRTSSIFNFQHVATRRNWGWPNGCATCCAQQCCDLLLSNVAIVWPEFANAGPTMFGYVALRCCCRLAGA